MERKEGRREWKWKKMFALFALNVLMALPSEAAERKTDKLDLIGEKFEDEWKVNLKK